MGDNWSRNWTESTVVGGRRERAEPEVRTPKQTERDWASFKEISDGAGEEVGLEAEGFFFLDFNP